jgi:hypothetical protein
VLEKELEWLKTVLCDTMGDSGKAFCVTQWETAAKRFSLMIKWSERETLIFTK